MVKQLLIFLGLRKKDNGMPIGNPVGGYEIHISEIGFYGIKNGDKFEGAACGHFFTDQTCQSVEEGDEGIVIGTTTLVSFRKCNIRPIKEGNKKPYLETYGTMKSLEQDLYKTTGLI